MSSKSKPQHWSDCAVHSEPAYPAGDCDCGGYTPPLLEQLKNPDECFPENFDTPKRANALLASLCQEAAELIEAQQKRIEELEAELKTERCLSFRTQVGELEEQIRHLQMALADTEALEMGTGERLAAAQKRIELYEQALLASWPEGAVGAAFDYWNAARMEDV